MHSWTHLFGAFVSVGVVALCGACVPHGMYPEPGDSGVEVRLGGDSGNRGRRPRGTPGQPGSVPDRIVPPAPAVDAAVDPPPMDPPSDDRAQFTPIRSDVMLLLDRSDVMDRPLDCAEPPCRTRWEAMMGLTAYLAPSAARARLGLALFPTQDSRCGVSDCVAVTPTEDQSVDAIGDALARVSPGGERPLAAAVRAVADEVDMESADGPHALIVITGGVPSCACEDPDGVECEREAAEEAVADLVRRIPTLAIHVIGFAVEDGIETEALDAIARAGGAARVESASTVRGLIEAVDRAVGSVAPCAYTTGLRDTRPDLEVTVDGVPVERCGEDGCVDGYSIESGRVLRFGETVCRRLRDGEPHAVRIERVR